MTNSKKNVKLTNVPASVYTQIAQMNCTLLQKAQLCAAVGINVLIKIPTVILNRSGEFLCSVYDISADEFGQLVSEIKPERGEAGDVGVLALGKAAIKAPYVAVKCAGRLIYRIVVSAAQNFIGEL